MSSPIRIHSPRFGVCIDEDTQVVDGCVLSSASCTTNSFFGINEVYQAPYEKTNDACTDAEKVGIGRCKSSLDGLHCGPTELSCGATSNFYDKSDPTCSLMVDKAAGTLVRTTFPACSNLDEDTWRCVLGLEDDCLDGERFTYSRWAEDWGPSPCHCEDVPTGICHYKTTDNDQVESNILTINNSFCAVSPRDCPPDTLWMTARDFEEFQFRTYDCRLCGGSTTHSTATTTVTTSITAITTYVVEAGACLEPEASHTVFGVDEVDSCALEAVSCPANFQFVSSETLKAQGINCPLEETKNWGTCASDLNPTECTNKATSCLYNFQPQMGVECDVHGNSETGLPTYFPNCYPIAQNEEDKREARCVWGELECDTEIEWYSKVNISGSRQCTCEDVLTGVCKEPSTGEYHCAVSPRACTDPASYILQKDLEAEGIAMRCQLCVPEIAPSNSSPIPPPVSPPIPPPTLLPTSPVPPPISFPTTTAPPTHTPILIDRPTFPPIPRPTNKPTSPPTTFEMDSQNIKKGNLSTGGLAGLAIAGALVCALIVLIVTMLCDNDEREPAEDPDLYASSGELSSDPDMPGEIVVEELPDHDPEPVASSGTMT